MSDHPTYVPLDTKLSDVLMHLERMRVERQQFADELHDAHDYSAEFPANDAIALQYAINRLQPEIPND